MKRTTLDNGLVLPAPRLLHAISVRERFRRQSGLQHTLELKREKENGRGKEQEARTWVLSNISVPASYPWARASGSTKYSRATSPSCDPKEERRRLEFLPTLAVHSPSHYTARCLYTLCRDGDNTSTSAKGRERPRQWRFPREVKWLRDRPRWRREDRLQQMASAR
jgi:hypothetical protein